MQMAIGVERSLREQQVGVFFVLPRVVRRVLQSELDIASRWQPPPHRKCCVIQRDRLLWYVARDELGIDANVRLPEYIILIAQPEEDQLATMTRQELQRYYWRLIFHARIDFEMTTKTQPRRTSVAEMRQRIDRIGQTAFDEIRSVLRIEQMLMRPDDDRNVYAEFVAVYHELSAFAPHLLPLYFPSLESKEAVLAVIGSECNAQLLLDETRPTDLSPEDEAIPLLPDEAMSKRSHDQEVVVARKISARHSSSLTRRAEKLSLNQNNVRAALVLQAAWDAAPAEVRETARERLEQEIHKLAARLQSALELSDATARDWQVMCEKLLPSAQFGFWNPNARLLYDLQSACIDHEHVTYKVDLLRWALSAGKSPLKRPLSNQRVVLMSKHLRSAALRVPNIEIDSEGRQELSELLHQAAGAAEEILRTQLEPLIEGALVDAGFTPASVVERVALKKMIRELADGIVERGFITLGDLRDAVSRNQLKMADLKDVNEFFAGDPLLRADRLMAASLDGVYPRGPFYLRWLQKANSLAYGIPWGRMLTRYVALPFGLAFLLLKTVEVALEHLPFIHLPGATTVAVSPETDDPTHVLTTTPPAETEHFLKHDANHSHHHVDLIYSHRLMFLIGCIIFALMHFPVFYQRVVWLLISTWTLIRILLIDTPRAILHWHLVDWLFKSFPTMIFRRYIFTPLLSTAFFWGLLPWLGFYPALNRWWGLAILIVSFAAFNSRFGRDTEEMAREFFSRTWYRIRVHLLMGLLTLVIDVFRAMMDGLERVLYAVDEWLRFRSGESNFTLGIKAVFGLIWSFVHGVVRFCVTLLIEPQVNPIKHFPVVTVSHKLVLTTLTVPIFKVLHQFFARPTASTITLLILTSIPGVFGFLAWELKENWKLYKANRSLRLKPVRIGSHGETLLRLLYPGFHSGTIPRLFANLRRAARRETGSALMTKEAKFVGRLQHEATALRHFFERELIELLSESRTFRDFCISVKDVQLTTNRVLVTLDEASHPDTPLYLEVTEQSGWLVAGTRDPGWLNELEPDDAEVFKAALTGFYKLAAIALVREQIASQLVALPAQEGRGADSRSSRRIHPYDIGPTGLVVWPNGVYETEAFYPLDEQPISHPRPRFLARATGLEPLPIEAIVFERNEIAWEEWQRFWDNEQNLPSHSIAKFRFLW